MLERLGNIIVRKPLQIISILIIITLFFGMFLPNIVFETDLNNFLPENDVVKADHRVEEYFGERAEHYEIYVGAKNQEKNVLTPKALREQFMIVNEANRSGVESVLSVAGFMDLACQSIYNKTLWGCSDEEIESITSMVKLYLRYQNLSALFENLSMDYSIQEVNILLSTLLSKDFDIEELSARATLIVVYLNGSLSKAEREEISIELRDRINSLDFEEIEVEQTSADLMTYDVNKETEENNIILGILIFILIASVLGLSFRGRISYIFLPIITLAMASIWTMGTMVLLGIKFTLIHVAVVPLIVGLGIDYSVHVSRRYQEELRKGNSVSNSLRTAIVRVGRPLTLAVVTTITAFLSNIFTEVIPVREFGIVCALGIFYAFILTLTFNCGVRYLLDRRSSNPIVGEREFSIVEIGMATATISVKRFPKLVIVWVVVVSLLSVYLATSVRTDFSLDDFFSQELPSMKALKKIKSDLPNSTQLESYILVEGEVATVGVYNSLIEAEKEIENDRYVVQVPNDLFDKGNTTPRIASIVVCIREAIDSNKSLASKYNFRLDGSLEPDCSDSDISAFYDYLYTSEALSDETKRVLHKNTMGEFDATVIRVYTDVYTTDEARSAYNQLKDDAKEIKGGKVIVTGGSVLTITTIDSLQEGQIKSTIASIILVAILLMLIFRDVTLGLISILPVILATLWILGTISFLGYSLNVLTITVTALTIGLGIDYAIHIVTRYREERKQMSAQDAVYSTINHTGSALFISALTTVLGFDVLLLSPMPLVLQFGLITATTIVYSFLVGIVVLPIVIIAWASRMKGKKDSSGVGFKIKRFK